MLLANIEVLISNMYQKTSSKYNVFFVTLKLLDRHFCFDTKDGHSIYFSHKENQGSGIYRYNVLFIVKIMNKNLSVTDWSEIPSLFCVKK